jgi:hypothetical protein
MARTRSVAKRGVDLTAARDTLAVLSRRAI